MINFLKKTFHKAKCKSLLLCHWTSFAKYLLQPIIYIILLQIHILNVLRMLWFVRPKNVLTTALVIFLHGITVQIVKILLTAMDI